MLNDLLVGFGVKASVISKLWQKASAGATGPKWDENSRKGLSIIHGILDLYKRQLLPGENLDIINNVLLTHIDNSLRLDRIRRRYGVTAAQVSLKDPCSKVLVDAITRTLFGNKIFEVEPDIFQHLLSFNDDAWMLVFHYSQFGETKLKRARRKILQAFVAYLQGPDETRDGHASPIENVVGRLAAAGVEHEDRAVLILMIDNALPYLLDEQVRNALLKWLSILIITNIIRRGGGCIAHSHIVTVITYFIGDAY